MKFYRNFDFFMVSLQVVETYVKIYLVVLL